jgi:sulfite oxidase
METAPTGKHPALIVHSEQPLNGGPPPEVLCRHPITPTDQFFIRNHAAIPEVDPRRYRLRIRGMVTVPGEFSLEELTRRFPFVRLPATMQCAGNRRKEFMAVAPIPGEIPWILEAIGTAVGGGVRLQDVLAAAGVKDEAAHVAFAGLDQVEKEGERFGFGGSIPLAKAMSAEVLLALEMNGAALAPLHGFPLRVIVPGYIGARSVKWVGTITVQGEPSSNYFQALAYKVFPRHVDAQTVDWTSGLMLGELPVNAAICQPGHGVVVTAGDVVVEGYAISGGRSIERVDVSANAGQTWVTAQLLDRGSPWTWRLFRATLTLRPGHHELVVRAWDSAGSTQPEDVRKIWNFKGYVNNAWHRVRVEAVG